MNICTDCHHVFEDPKCYQNGTDFMDFIYACPSCCGEYVDIADANLRDLERVAKSLSEHRFNAVDALVIIAERWMEQQEEAA